MNQSIYPSRDGDLDSWEENFLTKVSTYAKDLAVSNSELESIKNAINAHRQAFAKSNTKKAEAKSAVKENETLKNSTKKVLSKFVAKLKLQEGYTKALGKDLGIENDGSTIKSANVATLKPVLRISYTGGQVIIKFTKNGSQGIKVFGKRGKETEYTFLGVDTSSPYEDNRPNLVMGESEIRTFKAIYIQKDKEIGLMSDEVSINV